MFGVTTPCIDRVRELLEERGFELLIFHATGAGGQAMERLSMGHTLSLNDSIECCFCAELV